MVCHTTHLLFEPGAFMCRLWRHCVFVLPSGKDKRRKNIMSIMFILSNGLKRKSIVSFTYYLDAKCLGQLLD
jgi:hypothetical protein